MARIGIDIDDVIYPWYDRAHELCVEAGIAGDVTPKSWQVYAEYGVSLEEWVDVLVQAAERVYDLPPLPGALDALYALDQAGHDIVFITARGSFGSNGPQIEQWTREWLVEHVGAGGHGLRYEIHFSKDKTVVPTDYFIDDNADNVRALAAAGTHAYLRTRPWNADAEGLLRVDGIADFVDTVLEITSSPVLTHAPVASKSTEVRTVSTTGGEKGVKLARFDLIPAQPMWQVAELFGKGSLKYAARNWERGYEWGKSIGALERHLNLFKQGHDYDLHEADCPADCVEHTESHHMAAAVFHALALMEFERTHPEFDDRVVTGGPQRSTAGDRTV